jgi:hypothetical protein
MTTPAYQGSSQPPLVNGSGLLGRLGSIFGGETPAYSGDGQPSSSVGVLGRVTPAYAPAPTPPESIEEQLASEMQASCPIDPAALATGHIAIVIPRPACVPDRDDVAATD